MLPAAARLRHREDFQATFRRGRRAARGPLVVHALVTPGPAPVCPRAAPGPARGGFGLGKPVGGAVVRNRVRRRLRHLLRDRLAAFPPGARLVVRVQPGAGELTSAELGTALDAALARLDLRRPGSSESGR